MRSFGLLFFCIYEHIFNSLFVLLTDCTVLGRSLDMTLRRHCPVLALVVAAVLLEAVSVVPELLLERLDCLLVLD